MPSEKEKMLAGELYNSADPELVLARRRARHLLKRYNDSADEQIELRAALLRELCAGVGEGVWIEPPFSCDYGSNLTLGDRVYMNFNCVILDCATVTIGRHTFLGPGVQIYAATHPLDHVTRRTLESARPIVIGEDVWIGGAAIILPGVRIGSRSIIGAGAVVTRDVPEGVLVAGNPARVIRTIPDPQA